MAWQSVALAQPIDVSTRTAARELATQGAEAFERGDYAVALDHLSRANSLHPAPTISVLESRALVHLGRYIEALDRYAETQRATLADDAPDAFRAAVQDAMTEGDALRQRIPHLSIQVRRGGAVPKGISVTLDAKVLPAALLDVDIPIDPGEHSVLVHEPGHDPVTRRVHLSEKERVVLEITMDEYSSASVMTPAEKPPDTSATTTRGLWGWASVGGGAAATLLSALTGVAALDKKKALDSVCHPGCPEQYSDDISGFRRNRTISYVAGGTAIALVGFGGYLLLSDPASPTTIRAGVLGTQGALWGTF